MLCGQFEARIENDGSKCWMVLKPKSIKDIIHYQVNMLAYNDIYGIAPLHIRTKNDDSLFCYEIRQGLSPAFKEGQIMPVDRLVAFLCRILDVLSDSRKLLLEEKRFLLDQELIFTDLKGEPCLLYYPAEPCFDVLGGFKELVIRNLSVCAARAGAEMKYKSDKLLEELKAPGYDVNALRNVLSAYKKMVLTHFDAGENKQNPLDTAVKAKNDTIKVETDLPEGFSVDETKQKLFPASFKTAGLIFVLFVQIIAVSLSVIADQVLKNQGMSQYMRYSLLCAAIVTLNALLFKGILNGRRKMEDDEASAVDIDRIAEDDIYGTISINQDVTNGAKPDYSSDAGSDQRDIDFASPLESIREKEVFASLAESIPEIEVFESSSEFFPERAFFAPSAKASLVRESATSSLTDDYKNTRIPFSAETTVLCEISKKAWLKRSLTDHETAAEITRKRFVIGRNPEVCDMVIPIKTVGRVHAEIINRESEFFIIDKNSRNGTYINGRKLQSNEECKLCSGDSVVFSEEKFFFIL